MPKERRTDFPGETESLFPGAGASRFDGVVGDIDRSKAIPLRCREACNHFVAEARKASKAEYEAKAGT